ncbi:hypothetical protein ABPG72_017977 [Tetrahymena utriculariae]
MEVEEQQISKELLDNLLFVKWGIVISHTAWGKSKNEIAEMCNVKLPYVYQIIDRFEKEGEFKDKRVSNGGHNKIITEEMEEIITNETSKNPQISSNKLSQLMIDEYDTEISSSTINRIRSDLGMYYSKQASTLPISESARLQRLDYCKKHRNDKFTNVLFTDESNFQLFYNKNFFWFQNEDSENKADLPTNPNLKIMIWGGISLKGKTAIKIYRLDQKETVDSTNYIETLKQYCMTFTNSTYGRNKWKLMQDNTKPHVSAETTQFLVKKKIKTLNHPPSSLDLNPIQKVWAWMKRKIGKTTFKSITDLMDAVEEAWDEVPIDHIKNYITHHINQIQEVEQNNGQLL